MLYVKARFSSRLWGRKPVSNVKCVSVVCSATRSNNESNDGLRLSKRTILVAGALTCAFAQGAQAEEDLDLTITNKVFFDLGLCDDIYKSDRRLGDKSILCDDPTPLGRIEIGLYGKVVPGTVSQFLKLVEAGVYNKTSANRILQGEYVQWGGQGSFRLGQVELPSGLNLPTNSDVLSSKAFKLRHIRPGTVSFPLGEDNIDDPTIKERRAYRNTQFAITTGPGPCPSLDDQNVIFGTVTQGLDVIGKVATTPTFKPSGQLQAYNKLAEAFGDERAGKARRLWGKPLKAVVVLDSGVLL